MGIVGLAGVLSDLQVPAKEVAHHGKQAELKAESRHPVKVKIEVSQKTQIRKEEEKAGKVKSA